MVRDRVCNTFLPEEKALRVEEDGEEHFFCSEACRDRFRAGRTRGTRA
jgi:YHS domain-containing protein